MGSSCCVNFEVCMFEGCGRVVLDGAHATLVAPQFQCMSQDLSACAHGAGSCVVFQGGGIVGCMHGVLVQAGARSALTITKVGDVGVEVEDEGSSATLVDCKVTDCAQSMGGASGRGVHIRGGGRGCLDRCTISSSDNGLQWCDPGSHADATQSKLLDIVCEGMAASDHGSLTLVSCTSMYGTIAYRDVSG